MKIKSKIKNTTSYIPNGLGIFKMIRHSLFGDYKMSWNTKLTLLFSIFWLVFPFDDIALIPFIGPFTAIDELFVLGYLYKQLMQELSNYKVWKKEVEQKN